MGVQIAGWGSALPEREVRSDDLERSLGLPEGWIEGRTGIASRRVASGEETTTELAARAARAACAHADVEPRDVDVVLVATCTPDRLLPPTAPVVATRIGAVRAGAVDLGAACTGFLWALAQADGLIANRTARRVLVVGAETMSRITEASDARTAVLFGDGAGALLLESDEHGAGLGPFEFGSDGSDEEIIWAPLDDLTVRMRGREVYRRAVAEMAEGAQRALKNSGLGLDDVDLFIAHQANGRILDAVTERLGLTGAQVFSNIDRLGNTSAASIPLALADAAALGRLQDGDRVLLAAFGAGLSWGAGFLIWRFPVARGAVTTPGGEARV